MAGPYNGNSTAPPLTSQTSLSDEDLLDYVCSGGSPAPGGPRSDPITVGEEELLQQLAAKERDLTLAAQLGKALLEKNQQLTKKHEQAVEEFHQKMEELAQEKYALRLRLKTVEAEYESTVGELQGDISQLRHDLDVQEQQQQQQEQRHHTTIDDLTEQNERLTEQLRKVNHSEEHLHEELNDLRKHVQARRSSMHQHVTTLEVLRAEISMLSEQREELERRMAMLSEERNTANASLEEAQECIHVLERQEHQTQQQLHQQEREIAELRSTNSRLTDQLDGPPPHGHLDMTTSTSPVHHHNNRTSNSLFSELSMETETPHDNHGLKDEVLDVYRQLQRLHLELLGEGGEWTIDNIQTIQELKPGSLLGVLGELRALITDIRSKEDTPSNTSSTMLTLEQNVTDLRSELDATRNDLDRLKATLDFKDEELARKADELAQLNNKVKMSLQQRELLALQEERDRLQDAGASDSTTTRDDVLVQTRRERDHAMSKQQSLEVELAQSRLDLVQLDRQLMEAIQQKLELSQQLDLWQDDMTQLIDSQLGKKLETEVKKDAKKPVKTAIGGTEGSPVKRKLFSWRS